MVQHTVGIQLYSVISHNHHLIVSILDQLSNPSNISLLARVGGGGGTINMPISTVGSGISYVREVIDKFVA